MPWVDYTAPSNWRARTVQVTSIAAAAGGDPKIWHCYSSGGQGGATGNAATRGDVDYAGASNGGYNWDGAKWAAPSAPVGAGVMDGDRFPFLEFLGTLSTPLLGIRITAMTRTDIGLPDLGDVGFWFDTCYPYAEGGYTTGPANGALDLSAGVAGNTELVATCVFEDLDTAYVGNWGDTFQTVNGLVGMDDILQRVSAAGISWDSDNGPDYGAAHCVMHITKIELLLGGGFWQDLVNCEEIA